MKLSRDNATLHVKFHMPSDQTSPSNIFTITDLKQKESKPDDHKHN